jgi:RNA recognition motif-containing protein
MGNKLFVTNLPYAIRDRDLRELFGAHGMVRSAQVVIDRDSGRSRGFGFVEMATERDAQAALAALNGKEVEGRALTVTEARPREEERGARRGPEPVSRAPRKARKRPPALARRLRRPRTQADDSPSES